MSCLGLMLQDENIRICARQADLVRPKIHQKFSSSDMCINI